MIIDTLVNDVLGSEEDCINYLRQFGLFSKTHASCWKTSCSGVMKQTNRKGQPLWKCKARSCRTTTSFRYPNRFFYFTDKLGRPNCKLSFCSIVRLAHFFVHSSCTIRQFEKICGNSSKTICEWFHLFREVCNLSIDRSLQLAGTAEEPVQIDEAFFGGRQNMIEGVS